VCVACAQCAVLAAVPARGIGGRRGIGGGGWQAAVRQPSRGPCAVRKGSRGAREAGSGEAGKGMRWQPARQAAETQNAG